jgi:NADH-quinone oxidoreductase subunit M
MQAIWNHLLSFMLSAPLAGALTILLVGRRREGGVRWIAGVSAFATLILALPLWFKYDPHGKTWQFAERAQLIPTLGVSYYVGVDGFSILLILLTSLIACIAVVASWHDTTNVRGLYTLLLVLEAGLLGVFVSLDFLVVFLLWAGVLVAMFLLIGAGDNGRPLRSAFKFGVYMGAASLAVAAGILVLYFVNHAETGVYSFDITQLQTVRLPMATQKWVFVLFLIGFAATVALFPLHGWLPDAQADAPPAAGLMLGAVVLKMGAYAYVRLSLPILPDAAQFFAPAIAVLALIGLAIGAVFVWAQRDWIRFAAYSSVCHMALITLATFAVTPGSMSGSMLHQFNHGIAAAGLLLIIGLTRHRTNAAGLPAGGPGWKTTPLFAAVLLVMILSLGGLPAFGGFPSTIMIVRGVYAANKFAAVMAAIALGFVSASTLLLYRRTIRDGGSGLATGQGRDLTARELALFAPLVALSVWIGLHPAPFVATLETSIGRVVARVNPAYTPGLAQGSDCATPAPPQPSAPPPSFMLTESCADGSDAKK